MIVLLILIPSSVVPVLVSIPNDYAVNLRTCPHMPQRRIELLNKESPNPVGFRVLRVKGL